MTHGPFSRLYWVSNWDRFSQDLVCTQYFFGGEFDIYTHEFIDISIRLLVFPFDQVLKNIECVHLEDE